MFCKRCGHKRLDGEKFCPVCGMPFPDENGNLYKRGVNKGIQDLQEKVKEQKERLTDGFIESKKKFSDKVSAFDLSVVKAQDNREENTTTDETKASSNNNERAHVDDEKANLTVKHNASVASKANKENQQLVNLVVCPKCGKNFSSDFLFCPYCSTKLDKQPNLPLPTTQNEKGKLDKHQGILIIQNKFDNFIYKNMRVYVDGLFIKKLPFGDVLKLNITHECQISVKPINVPFIGKTIQALPNEKKALYIYNYGGSSKGGIMFSEKVYERDGQKVVDQQEQKKGMSKLAKIGLSVGAGLLASFLGSELSDTFDDFGGDDCLADNFDLDGDGVMDSYATDTDGDGVVDSVAVDSDNDSVYDTLGIDSDGDGKIDALAQDTDGDGTLDSYREPNTAQDSNSPKFVDTDGDGIADVAGVDTDGDGNFDTAMMDTDKNGVMDTLVVDSDMDGKADTFLRDSDGDGVVDKVFS